MLVSFRPNLVVLATLLFSMAAIGMPQDQQPKTTIKRVPIKPTPANSGAEMYKNYCAACHGPNAKGDGPAAPALKTPPPDLTLLAKRNNGQFPATHVEQVLKFGPSLAAHGTPEMPVWGPLLSVVSARNQAIVSLRVSNLTKYLESLQVK
jgi:mono/diheme cytochrome c family protein